MWNSLTNYTKYFKRYQSGKAVPVIRLQVEEDFSLLGLAVEKSTGSSGKHNRKNKYKNSQ